VAATVAGRVVPLALDSVIVNVSGPSTSGSFKRVIAGMVALVAPTGKLIVPLAAV
jgi:hypothetical protein